MAVLLIALAMVACEPTNDDPAPVPTLSVAPESILAAYTAGTYAIAVTSDTAWTVNSSAAWCTLNSASGTASGTVTGGTVTVSTPDNASGTASGTVTVSVNENLSTAAQRNATVTFTAGTLSRTVTVTQAARPTLPYAASTQTWTFGSSTLTWSDAIHIPDCTGDTFANSDTVPQCRSYAYTAVGKTFYYYNWPYVDANKATMCPDPWRVPTKEDFYALIETLGGNTQSAAETLGSAWGFGGYTNRSSVYNLNTIADYWSASEYEYNSSYVHFLCYTSSSFIAASSATDKYAGQQVRCVK